MRQLFLVGHHIVSTSLERNKHTRINIIASSIHVKELIYRTQYDCHVAYVTLNEGRLAFFLGNTALIGQRAKYTILSYTLN